MSEQTLIEQLDALVETMVARADAGPPPADAQLVALLRIAADLRDLPREEFKARLKADLERKAAMTTQAVKPTKQGLQTVIPYLAVREAAALVDFTKQAFGAIELLRTTGTQGGMHAEVQIGDSRLMIGGGEVWHGTPMPTALHVYVEDADAVYERALQAGATSFYKPMDQPYGDREAGVKDASGNSWYIATHQGARHIPEGLGTVTPCLHPQGGTRLIDFLKRAFGAEESVCEMSPEGTVLHARISIGNSVVEIGEAHGPIQPTQGMFYLYVPDVDALYARAVNAGGTSLEAPANQPYGDRRAAVTDAFGNQWYMATPVGGLPR